jgi:hypothetical protein
MKSKLLKITLLLFFFSTLTIHAQNKLYIHEKGGATQSFALSEIKKMTFTEDNMFLARNEANTVSFFIKDIDYMGFQSSVNILEKQTENFSIYPNPVTNNLTVEHTETIDDLKIFDMQGKIYLHLSPKKETVNIDMTSFAAGIYFLRIVSNDKINTSKVIKNSNN